MKIVNGPNRRIFCVSTFWQTLNLFNEMTLTGPQCGRGRKQKIYCIYIYFVIDFDLFNESNLPIHKIIHCVLFSRQKNTDGDKRKTLATK